ncbi:MAG: RHS repeat-associated core domain-containing protein, partial [Bacteroidota bacterium]
GIDMSGKGNSSTAPRAFVNYIFFDQEMNYVRAGFLQVTTAAQGIGVHETISLHDIIADRKGYILAYLSNENAEEVAIHWDDFTVYQGKTNVVFASSYYPFGMRYNSYQRIASSTNFMNTFQNQEYDAETGWVQFKWRNHMPDIGRFFNIDPLATSFYYNSSYAFSENKVVAHVELEGAEALDFRTHIVMNATTPSAGLISYATDYLYDKIVGGGARYIQGGIDYAVNEYNHANANPAIPESYENLRYNINKIQAITKSIQGVSDQIEGYSTLMSLAMGGAEGTLGKQAVQNSNKLLKEFAEGIMSNPQTSADDIAAQFTDSGFKATVKEMRSGRGHMITVNGHSQINTIKVHGGGGRHTSSRIQIQGQNNNIDIKIVQGSRDSYKGNIAEEEAAGRMFIFLDEL